MPKLDSAVKSTGRAIYTLDVKLPGMLTALVAHPPAFGATVASFDGAAARRIAGVMDVKAVPQGVAVYAESMWAALKGRDALHVDWDTSKAEKRSSARIIAEYQEKARTLGHVVANRGEIDGALRSAAKTLEAEYVFPYLAHAPMEPLDAVLVRSEDGGVDAYMGSQIQTGDQAVIGSVLGLAPDKVRIHTQLAGGSFGRRAQGGSNYAAEAAHVFKAFGGTRPVKHVWTREDDIKGGFYRPIFVHRLKGALDARGPDRRLGPDRRRPVDPRRHAIRGRHDRRPRPEFGRGRQGHALLHPELARLAAHDQGRRASKHRNRTKAPQGRDVLLSDSRRVVSTAAPHAMPSSTGRPKPSPRLG